MNGENHAEQPPIAFCQNCGKPLNKDTVRVVGPAIFCEPCLEARLAGATAAPTGPDPVRDPEWVAPPTPGDPNPGLAALLGFIPGVGAMYNGQYAKGIVHLIIFVVLINLGHEVSGLFILFVFGWVFYMVIEAHHTARARRDGTPLPNPFGLNDLSERMGFGRAWPGHSPQPGAPFAPFAPFVPPGSPVPPTAGEPRQGSGPGAWPGSSYPPPAAAPGDPQAAAMYGQPSPMYGQAGAGYGQPGPGYSAPYAPPQAGWSAPPAYPVPPAAVPPVPPVPPYGAYTPVEVPLPPEIAQSRFPIGAVWLIGLGIVFLLANAGLLRDFRPGLLVGGFLVGLGAWIFIQRMTSTGAGFANDGSSTYGLRLFRALRGSVWIASIGVLFLLNEYGILLWHQSWPWVLILPGLMAIFERLTYSGTPVYPQVPSAGASAHNLSPSPVEPLSGAPTHREEEGK